ncbi:CvfB family protein [Flexithrix dorotheae]|uniref:CvfB family protein n=1 Tax=Flexithrix dorotheae TaxID=70993 RepID=UPI00036C7C39|nr:S1-like domain-containing RNA-binding protein [Flexithrix dorotheae]
MAKIGEINLLEVCKVVDFGYYLKSGEQEILLPTNSSKSKHQVGEKLEVFIYTDSEDRIIASEILPKGVVGDFVALKVKDTNKFGAFLDWGLLKDLMVPFSEQYKRMSIGKTYVVRIGLDRRTNRLIGMSKLKPFLKKSPDGLEEGQEVNLMVYDITTLGYSCLINNSHQGVLYRNEVFRKIGIGDSFTGFIGKIREDGKIDLTLRKSGYHENNIEDDGKIILEKLAEVGGFLPYNDKTDAEVIKKEFQMSKKYFKKVIGNLYKNKKIEIGESGIIQM